MIYRTDFKLTAPVNDIKEARNYLQEDDMTSYLIEEIDIAQDEENSYRRKGFIGLDSSLILSLKWELTDERHGYVELETKEPLTEKQLESISDFVRGQNSDGLGEGFEQQEFAENFDEESYDTAMQNYEEDGECYPNEYDYRSCASFDWRTNKYIFSEVKEKTKDDIER